MNQKLVRYQLIAFVVVTVLGIGYAMANYVGLGKVMGFSTYSVAVDLPAAGGLYANAAVTQRGVTVGKVDDIHLTHTGVVADISLNDGTKIPQNLHAAVANTSAIGEQYLELTPESSGGPYLTAGSVIPASKVSLPPNVSTVLANVNTLLRTVPKQQLDVTVNELYKAFNGTGPDLRNLLVSSSNLLQAASQNLGPTKALVNESNPVLATQARNAANIKAFARNLDAFTTQLRASNKDLTGTIDRAPGLTSQLNDLIGQLQPTVPLLLSNLTSTANVLRVYLPNVQQTLVVLPAAINDLTADIDSANAAVPQGGWNINLMTDVNNPAPCTTGYQNQMRQPSDTAAKSAPNPTPYCTVSHSSASQVRGAHNYPCPNNPSLRSANAAGCGLNFGTGGGTAAGSGSGSTSAATYNATNGLLVGPQGLLYSVGSGSLNGTGPTTLAGLLKQTLGN